MLHAQDVHAADQLEDVQKHLRHLQQKEEQIRQQLSDRSLQAVCEINRSGLPSDDPAQRPLPDLLQEATVLDTGAKYLERLEARLLIVQCGRMHAVDSEIAACTAYHEQVHTSQLQHQFFEKVSTTYLNPFTVSGLTPTCSAKPANTLAAGAAARCCRSETRSS